ncbi:MAG: hypothetical protein LBG61_03565 [Burkholderiales bacterium]|jgi:hypothetical protein|nr:hypothetical protein [Burkholderiales bacterium]
MLHSFNRKIRIGLLGGVWLMPSLGIIDLFRRMGLLMVAVLLILLIVEPPAYVFFDEIGQHAYKEQGLIYFAPPYLAALLILLGGIVGLKLHSSKNR